MYNPNSNNYTITPVTQSYSSRSLKAFSTLKEEEWVLKIKKPSYQHRALHTRETTVLSEKAEEQTGFSHSSFLRKSLWFHCRVYRLKHIEVHVRPLSHKPISELFTIKHSLLLFIEFFFSKHMQYVEISKLFIVWKRLMVQNINEEFIKSSRCLFCHSIWHITEKMYLQI